MPVVHTHLYPTAGVGQNRREACSVTLHCPASPCDHGPLPTQPAHCVTHIRSTEPGCCHIPMCSAQVFHLLSQIVPNGLLMFLVSKEEAPDVSDLEGTPRARHQRAELLVHWSARAHCPSPKQGVQLELRQSRTLVKSAANWNMFFYEIMREHLRVDLIWNHHTREELKEACESELRSLSHAKELHPHLPVVWNHCEFEVQYPSLADEVCRRSPCQRGGKGCGEGWERVGRW